jgi:iron complex transport system substrate-binding protein
MMKAGTVRLTPVRKTFFLVLICAIVSIGFIGYCRSYAASPPSKQSGRVITDLVGNKVAIPKTVNKVGALVGPSYDKIAILGDVDKIVMCGTPPLPWAQKFYPSFKQIPVMKNSQAPNIEDLLKQKVDVVFFWDIPAPIKQMTDAGIPVVVTQLGQQVGPQTQQRFLDLFKNEVKIFADVLGPDAQKRANEYLSYFDKTVKRITSVTSRIPANERLKVYYVRGPNPLTTHFGYSNTYWLVNMAGGDLVTKELINGILGDVTMEQVVVWNPDIILMGRVATTDPIIKDAKWSDIKAVKNGKVFVNPGGAFYSDYGSESALLLMYLAKTFYPDKFADIDMTKETKYFYSHFYRYQLSDNEANRILSHQDPM